MDDPVLSCKAHELEVGTEFSCDEGRTWLVVRTELRYVSDSPECSTLRFMASPAENTSLWAWEEIQLDDWAHVLLERNWGKEKK